MCNRVVPLIPLAHNSNTQWFELKLTIEDAIRFRDRQAERDRKLFLKDCQDMFDKIVKEVDDRKGHLSLMERNKVSTLEYAEMRNRMEREINERVIEMKKIDAMMKDTSSSV